MNCFVGIAHLRYREVVKYLLTVSAQLSHLLRFFFFFCTQAIAYCAGLCEFLSAELDGVKTDELGGCDYCDGDYLGSIKANEHSSRPLKNSPRTLNQTVSAPLVMAMIIMTMMMPVRIVILINYHDERQNMMVNIRLKSLMRKFIIMIMSMMIIC